MTFLARAARLLAIASTFGLSGTRAAAQRPTLSLNVHQYVSVDTTIVALTHVRVIDGTGAPARENQTLIIQGGNIAELGDAATVTVPL